MNVVVVVCNSLHLGFIGTYGNAWIETPNLDRLAAEGIVFDHHFPENLTTLPTRRSWWTGRLWLRRRRTRLDAPSPRGTDSARLSLGPGRPHRVDFRCPPAARGGARLRARLRRGRSGCAARAMTRSSLAGDPRAKHVSLEEEPGLRLPPEDDPDRELLAGALGTIPPQPRGAPRSR